jgi:hypothetical protein
MVRVQYNNVSLAPISGNVGIGTTSPGKKLSVEGNASTAIKTRYLYIGSPVSSGSGWTRWYLGYGIYWDESTKKWKAISKTYRSLFINDNETIRFIVGMPKGEASWNHSKIRDYSKFYVTSKGEGYFSDVVYAKGYRLNSSREYKQQIKALSADQATSALKNLNPVTFKFKNDNDENHVGFIAEELPELVANKDRKTFSLVDIVAVLTKVVQLQQKEIEELKAQIKKRK